MNGSIRMAVGALLSGIGISVLFGVPISPIAGLTTWPIVGMVLTIVGLAVFLSGLDRMIAEQRVQNGSGDLRKLKVRLVKLQEKQRMAEHRHWLASEDHKRYKSAKQRSRARDLLYKRDTEITKAKAKIVTTEALIAIAESSEASK